MKHRFFENSFFPATKTEWNDLDYSLLNAPSINVFKQSILIRLGPNKVSKTYNPHDLKLSTRLRFGLSHLRSHKFKHNFIDWHTVPLTIWHHLFLEFWLVDTWIFAHWRHQCTVTCPENVRQLDIRRGKAGFPIVTESLSWVDEVCMCGKDIKSTNHFLLQYFLYIKDREVLVNKVRDIDSSLIDQNENYLCYTIFYVQENMNGNENAHIFNARMEYILATERFNVLLFE